MTIDSKYIETQKKPVPITEQIWPEKTEPVVSISCITYNHENFIRDAIEGFLIQKTTFPVEILIHDDASTDKTASIVKEYAEKHSDLIIPIFQTENQYSQGNKPLANFVFPRARGKYIALCEGDDYWTDPLKLQKQVDFLEANPDFKLCFHNATIKWDNNSKPDSYFCAVDQKPVSTIEDVIKGWFIPSASMVFRREAIMPLPGWFSNVYNGDWALQMLAASKGKIGYLNETMSVYRKQPGNLSATIKSEFIWMQRIKLLHYFNLYTSFKYNDIINERIDTLIKEYNQIIKTPKSIFAKLFSYSYMKNKIYKLFHLNKYYKMSNRS